MPECGGQKGSARQAADSGQLRSVNKPSGPLSLSLWALPAPGSPRWTRGCRQSRACDELSRNAAARTLSSLGPARPRQAAADPRGGPVPRRPQPWPGYLAAAAPPPRLTRGARRPRQRRRRRLPHGPRRRAEPGPSPPPSAPPPTPLLPPPPSRLSQDMVSAGPRAAPSGRRGGEAAQRRGPRLGGRGGADEGRPRALRTPNGGGQDPRAK